MVRGGERDTVPGLEGPLWRALLVFRIAALGYAAALMINNFRHYAWPAGGWLIVGVMVVWTAVSSLAYARPERRGWPLLTADLAVAAGCLLASRWIVDPGGLVVGAPTLPMAWVACPVVAWAISGGRRRGAIAAILLSAGDVVVRDGLSQATANGPVLMILAGIGVGHIARLAIDAESRMQRAIELEAATRERERLARGIHDSVLQVLALVQRRGAELGGEAADLGRLAGEQEAVLRALVTSAPPPPPPRPPTPNPSPSPAASSSSIASPSRAASPSPSASPALAPSPAPLASPAPAPDSTAPDLGPTGTPAPTDPAGTPGAPASAEAAGAAGAAGPFDPAGFTGRPAPGSPVSGPALAGGAGRPGVRPGWRAGFRRGGRRAGSRAAPAPPPPDLVDLRTLLDPHASPAVTIASPATPVLLLAPVAAEIVAAVAAALDNVARHAGPEAKAWLLVEELDDAVAVTVRDNGPGIPDGRLAEAQRAGRLGVAQSIRGRIRDLGGTVTVTSSPTAGTEVELQIPR
ncbi:DUF5931 domain-containing protein [Dactylosporangium sp. NPDC048998]|uniref:DUF5931 domain-containing protein n=1 Tax=Dactylosporangium sp. NPDC048998 TaxID=3363976 RepID=UPI0037209769